uniref:Retrotransposon gag domain-containing protein n=1 Tax=Meloidogyne javanica TaxID=6303 RepID=A0A915MYW2_MELJA
MAEIANLADEMKNLNIKISGLGSKPPINLEIYKGRKDNRTFSNFINAYNKVATAYGWSEMEMCRMFPFQAEKSNWGMLIDRMAKKFAIGESVSHFRRVASTRRQRVNESISEFSEAISQLVDKGYPDSGGFSEEIRKGLAIEFFRNGLRAELRETLRKMQKPKTMPEATLQAMEEEEALQELAREKIANAQFEQINQISQINQITQENARKVEVTKNSRNNTSNQPFRGPFQNFRENFRNVWWRMPQPQNWRNPNRNGFNRNFENQNRFNNYRNQNRPNTNRETQNRNQYGNFRRGNSNFVPLGNRGGQRRGRGGYKINSVNTTRKSPSPVFPLLTILSALLVGYLSHGYQICVEEEEPLLLAPPEKANCTVPTGPDYEEYTVEIYVPQKRALIFTGFKCQKFTFGKSTFSFLRLYNSDDDFKDITSPVPKEECWKLVKEVEWPVFGTQYFYEYDYIVQIGNVYVNMDTKIVKTDLGFYDNCSIPERKCLDENSTMIWDDPTEVYCPYESAGNFRALLSFPYILVENLQAVFIFSNFFTGNITLGERECFGYNTYYMENDVFISIPKLKDFPGTTFHAAGINYELEGDREEEEEPVQEKAREIRDLSGLKRARKMTERPTQAIVEGLITTESTTQSTEKPSTTESTTQSTTERPSNTERTTQLTTEKLTTTERPTQPTPEKPIRATEQTKITKNPSTRKQILTENNKVEDMVTKPKLFTGTQANTVKPKELTTEFPETTEKLTTEITQKIVENIIPITTTVYKKLDEKTEPITEKRPLITLEVGNNEFKALADSGASISYCKQSIAKKLGKIEFDLQPNIKAEKSEIYHLRQKYTWQKTKIVPQKFYWVQISGKIFKGKQALKYHLIGSTTD